MQRAAYGPLRLTDDVAYMGIGEGDFVIRFTSDGIDKGGPTTITWSDIHRIDAHISAGRTSKALEFTVNLLNFGVTPGPSIVAKDSMLSIFLKSGKRISWSFTEPSSRSAGKWNRKNVKILFEELSSLGMLSLLGNSSTAEQLLTQLGTIQPPLPWQRRRQIASIITQVRNR